MEWVAIVMFVCICFFLMLGYPVALTLAGTALLFAFTGAAFGVFELVFLNAITSRIFSGIMQNEIMLAVPLFVFMGVVLEKTKMAEDLLDTMAMLFGQFRGGLAISVCVVGALLAASTGIVGATVVTMGLLSLPTMMRRNYSKSLAAGTICASGTLGQIIPPSIVLVLLGDVLSTAYTDAQLKMGNFSPDTVSVGDLFVGALIPGFMLVGLYIVYIILRAFIHPETSPAIPAEEIAKAKEGNFLKHVMVVLLPPLVLVLSVLGSILAGIATPTEAAAVGAVGALILAAMRKKLNVETLKSVCDSTLGVNAMVFFVLIGASFFSVVFRGYGGEELVERFLHNLPGGKWGALFIVMLIIFLLGFILDFIEITFVVIPIVGPVLLMLGFDPVWLGIMIAINLQTSFLTPPFGFALFYLRGVAPPEVTTLDIYKGVLPYIVIQVIMLVLLALLPEVATWLPNIVYG